MAKTISCRDVGVDCDFTAKADTLDELMQVTAKHAKEAHGFDSIPPELMPVVQAAIRDE
jgi:predicted small metal-binding protein